MGSGPGQHVIAIKNNQVKLRLIISGKEIKSQKSKHLY